MSCFGRARAIGLRAQRVQAKQSESHCVRSELPAQLRSRCMLDLLYCIATADAAASERHIC
eukprot:4594209-Pleurochrysis_carterae.AAC.1